MTDSSVPAPSHSLTPNPDNTRWTGDKAGAFLKLLARSGKVGPCARAVGMSRQSAYRLRDRAPAFAQLWEVAMGEAARRRASALGGRRRKRVHPLLAKRPEQAPDPAPYPGDTLGGVE